MDILKKTQGQNRPKKEPAGLWYFHISSTISNFVEWYIFFAGLHCEDKSNFAYIAGGVAGGVIFLILLVLLGWMICFRANRARRTSPEKILGAATDANGSQVNFYYGAPAPYAESIAPSHHSTYAHYYDDEEDGWEMPNFYNET